MEIAVKQTKQFRDEAELGFDLASFDGAVVGGLFVSKCTRDFPT